MIQGSNEWLEARKCRITGSNVGAILGVDPMRSAADVMRAMAREFQGAEPEIDEFAEDVIFSYGRFHENGAVIDYMMETGNQVAECGFYEYDDWLGASPDRLVLDLLGDNGLAEIKCPWGKRKVDNPIFKTAAELPHYYAQMQIEMLCTGLKWVDFYQWAPNGSSLERVEYNQQWIDENLPKLRAFYELYIKERKLKKYLEPKIQEIDSAAAQMLIDEHDQLKEAIELAEARKKEIFAALVEMCKNDKAKICGRTFFKKTMPGKFSTKKFAADHPDIDLKKYNGEEYSFWQLI